MLLLLFYYKFVDSQMQNNNCGQSNKFGVKYNLSKLKTSELSHCLPERADWRVTRLRLAKRGDLRVAREDVELLALLVDVRVRTRFRDFVDASGFSAAFAFSRAMYFCTTSKC